MMAAIYNGVLNGVTQPLAAHCPSGNCTWPTTTSMAVCGACSDSTYQVDSCDQPCSKGDMSCSDMPNCNYTLPTGESVNLVDEDSDDFPRHSRAKTTAFHSISSLGSIYDLTLADRMYLMNVELFGAPFGWNLLNSEEITLRNTECALWLCVQAYNTTVSSSGQQETLVSVLDEADASRLHSGVDTAPNLYWMNFTVPPISPDASPETNFTVNLGAARNLRLTMALLMNGSIDMNGDAPQYSSDTMFGVWNGTRDVHGWIDNLAAGMTTVIRSYNQTSRDEYLGTSYELSVRVRWVWLIFPVALVSSSILFLIAVMVRTALYSEADSWKGSPLTFLLFELQSEIRHAGLRRMQESGWKTAQKDLGKTRVRLVAEPDGGKKFHAL